MAWHGDNLWVDKFNVTELDQILTFVKRSTIFFLNTAAYSIDVVLIYLKQHFRLLKKHSKKNEN